MKSLLVTMLTFIILFITQVLLPSKTFAADCAIVGDSIAEGLGRISRDRCVTNAKIGIPSYQVVARVPPYVLLVVISSGSNDPDNPKLERNLRAARVRATGYVVWILPINVRARNLVLRVAAENNDFTVSFKPAKDNVHPKSYGPIKRTIELWAYQKMNSGG